MSRLRRHIRRLELQKLVIPPNIVNYTEALDDSSASSLDADSISQGGPRVDQYRLEAK